MHCDSIDSRISGYLDGELTQQEAQRVRLHLAECESCRQTCESLLEVKRQVGALDNDNYPGNADAELLDLQRLERMEKDPFARFLGWTGWILLVGSWLASWLLMLADINVEARWLHIGLLAGGGCLLVSVLRQQLMIRKTDKYRKVKL